MNFSQNNEEDFIVEFFKGRTERFLDVGAHNGVNFSNTRQLAVNGWRGVCVEPSPAAFHNLMYTYRDRSDIDLVNVAIVPTLAAGIIEFFDSHGDFLSTTHERHKNFWATGTEKREAVNFQTIYLRAVTFTEFFKKFPGPYPFVSVDVEGINFELFKELPLQDLGVELVCVEFDKKLMEIEAWAGEQSYKKVHITNENVLLARVSS